MPQPLRDLVLVTNILSSLGCGWVLFVLTRRKDVVKAQRIFPGLMFSLALSDLLMHIGYGTVALLIICGAPSWATTSSSNACTVLMGWCHAFRFVSVLQEVHVAVYFVLQGYRIKGDMRRSRCIVACCWTAGMTMGILDVFWDQWQWDPNEHWCTLVGRGPGHSYLSVVVLMFCFLASFVCYILVLVRSCKPEIPGSVMHRALRRTAIYPMNFWVSYFLTLFIYIDQTVWDHPVDAPVIIWAFFLLGCNGLLNSVAYACQGRYAVTMVRRKGTAPRGQRTSMLVEVGGTEVIEYMVSYSGSNLDSIVSLEGSLIETTVPDHTTAEEHTMSLPSALDSSGMESRHSVTQCESWRTAESWRAASWALSQTAESTRILAAHHPPVDTTILEEVDAQPLQTSAE